MAITHTFHATAFVDNFSLKELAASYPGARRSAHELSFATPSGGVVFVYPFGALVFYDLGAEDREAELARLLSARPGLRRAQVITDEFTVRETSLGRIAMDDGVLIVDRLTADRIGVVASTIAQSAAMDYYEGVVDELFGETQILVDRLEAGGSVPLSTRPLHRFIGRAVSTRNEVLSVLHLLDKPDAIWDDAGVERIHEELRVEFDLLDRHQAMESKLRSVVQSLEVMLDVARDRRLVLLEGSIVLLIMIEIVLALTGRI